MCSWHFRRMERAELNSDPVEGEFFTPHGIADSLVREAIQNSLDARSPDTNEPVTVRFAIFHGSRAIPAARAAHWLEGLWPHLRAQKELEDLPGRNDSMPFLVVEDFGTRGLTGDPRQEDDRETTSDSKNHFYYFWRNIGRSAKAEKERGRWGLGKTVFPATSRINSFLGLTVRKGDGRPLLMGQSVLKVHKVESKRVYPYGYYANFADDEFALPIGDARTIARFRDDFSLLRDDRPGLSVVLPFPDPDLGEDDLLRSAIIQYFQPILSGQLVVKIEGEQKWTIDEGSIDSVTQGMKRSKGFDPESLAALYRLTRWARTCSDEDHLDLEPSGGTQAPQWDESLFPENTLDETRKQFEAGRPLAIRPRVSVQPKGTSPAFVPFSVYLERDETLERPEEHYVRQGITIPGIRRVRDRRVRGLVVVEDPLLSSLLGDSEGPAHRDWQERQSLVRNNYQRGAFTVRFVRNALRELVAQLVVPPEGRDENLLIDVFNLQGQPTSSSTSAGGPKRRRRRRRTPPPPEPPEPRPRKLRLEKTGDGFRLAGNPDVLQPGERIVVRAAYAVRRGNPFKNYDPMDFRFDGSELQFDSEGVQMEKRKENILELEAERPDFRLTVTGFDDNRDLVVTATPRGIRP